MYTCDGGPREPEKPDRDQHSTSHRGGESELRLGNAVIVCNEPEVVSPPERVCEDAAHHAEEKPEESTPDHLEVKVVDVREDEGEGLEEDV